MDKTTSESLTLELADPDATERLGGAVAGALRERPGSWLIALEGGLGAGKTTLVRGFLRNLGYRRRVPSPTYTLVEPYEVAGRTILHVDLYRLSDPEELEYIGFRELLSGDAIVLVEWPERAAGIMPPADLHIRLKLTEPGRIACLRAGSPRGEDLASSLGNSTGR